jgi:uncharacterized membrane protein YgcG
MRLPADPRRIRRTNLAAFFALALALLFAAAPVAAQDVPKLEGLVTDKTQEQVLASKRAQVEQALNDLQDRDGIQLFALFVDTTDNQNVADYTREVGQVNSLGNGDVLMVVALKDRTYFVQVDPSLSDRITSAEVQQIGTSNIEPRLRAGDYAGAITGTATGLRQAITDPGPVTEPGPVGEPGPVVEPRPVPSGGFNFLPILGVGLLVLGGLWVFGVLRSSQRQRQGVRLTAEERDRRTGELAREANQQLIRADDAMRDADQELAFAEAQFGDTEVVPFREALKAAGVEMKAAFALRQKLDDEIPEDPDTREKMLREVLERAKRAQALLDEQRSRIEQLRDLERTAPQILEALPAQVNAVEARIADAEQTLTGLSGYADTSWQSVKGNVPEARKRLDFARQQVDTGRQASQGGDRTQAARNARAAQEAVAEAARLLEAITAVGKSVREAEQRLSQELTAASVDLRSAEQAVARSGNGLRPRLAEAEGVYQAAVRESGRPKPDYVAAYRLATQANSIADEILAGAQQEEQRRSKEQARLEAALHQAESSYNRAADYIASRRRGVGRTARTRLVEAENHLQRAMELVDSDPHTALTEALRAAQLADQAYAQATDDFDDYDGGGILGGGRRGGIFPFPIIIGGGGWGGGNSGGGWGGTPWGSGGGGGFGGGSSGGGGFGGGGFGGGSSGGGRW